MSHSVDVSALVVMDAYGNRWGDRYLENVVSLARRVVSTPYEQHLLILDRLNDLDVALGDYDRARAALGETNLARLIREAVEVADYGLGRDGCPFCSGMAYHNATCIAVVFGAYERTPG